MLTKPLSAVAQPESGTHDPGATTQRLHDLTVLAGERLKQARDLASMASNVGGSADKAQASLRYQELELTQQASLLASQIQSSEAELARLRQQAAQVEGKRAVLAGSMKRCSNADGGAAAKKLAARHEHQLQSAHGLETLLTRHCDTIASVAGQHSSKTQQTVSSAPFQYLSALQTQLQCKALTQGDLLVRLERLQKTSVQQLSEQELREMGMEKEQAQLRAKLKTMIKDIRVSSEELMGGVEAHQAALERHSGKFPGTCAPALQRINSLLAHLHSTHAALQPQTHSLPTPHPPPQGHSTSAEAVTDNVPGQLAPLSSALPPTTPSILPVASAAANTTSNSDRGPKHNHSKPSTAPSLSDTPQASQPTNLNRKENSNHRNRQNSNRRGGVGGTGAGGGVPSNQGTLSEKKNVARNANVTSATIGSTAPSSSQPQPPKPQPEQAQPTAPAPSTDSSLPQPQAEPVHAPAPAPVSPPKRGWGVIAKAPVNAPLSQDDLPTPAEALAKNHNHRKKNTEMFE